MAAALSRMVEVSRTDRPDVEFVHSLRSIVATDREGKPSCLALILKDVSDQFEAEERFEATFNANPAPAIITRLSDLRHVKVNIGFLEMTGFTRDAVLRSAATKDGMLIDTVLYSRVLDAKGVAT